MSGGIELRGLQARLGHDFAQPRLLERALTHRSFGADHYERLEFLGDAVLNLAVSDLLFERYADSAEGDLTRIRAHLVREATLHRLALDLGLPALLRLSEGESRGGGAQRPSILADALEALIGAVWRDGGLEPARALVGRLFTPLLDGGLTPAWSKDAKTQLQEWLQARRQPVPAYRIESTQGQAHEQTFTVVCSVPAYALEGRGEGRSRRSAEQQAAAAVLALLPGAG